MMDQDSHDEKKTGVATWPLRCLTTPGNEKRPRMQHDKHDLKDRALSKR
jgi:hypothetical protein